MFGAAPRDFGPMLKAELRASETGDVVAPGDKPLADYSESALAPPADAPKRAINAFLPILTVVLVTVGGMARNLAIVIAGNLVGGSLLVALVYHVIYRERPAAAGVGASRSRPGDTRA